MLKLFNIKKSAVIYAIYRHNCIYNLLLDDSHITNFDTNYKLDPPLRTKGDIDALIKGLEDGTIDVISSYHQPQNIENKSGLGLGTFIGKTLLERMKAKVEFTKSPKTNGAMVIVRWNTRDILSI